MMSLGCGRHPSGRLVSVPGSGGYDSDSQFGSAMFGVPISRGTPLCYEWIVAMKTNKNLLRRHTRPAR